jgi:hypothetical protein
VVVKYSYFTSIAAYNYFLNGGETMLVARVVSGSFSEATSTPIVNGNLATTASVIYYLPVLLMMV